MTGNYLHDQVKYVAPHGLWMQADVARISWYGRPASVTYVRDVTEQKQLQLALERENSGWQRLVNHIPSGLAIVKFTGDDLVCLGVNDYCLQILGIAKEKMVDKNFAATANNFLPEDAARRRRDWDIIKETGSLDAVYRFYNPNRGKISWVELRTRVVDQPDGTKLAYVTYFDINAQREAEMQAQQNRQLYETAVEAAQLVMWEYDIPGRRIIVGDNKYSIKHYERLGYPAVIENVPDSLLWHIAESSIPAVRAMYDAVGQGQDAACDVWGKEESGRKSQCAHITYRVVRPSQGRPVKAYGIAQDVTARKVAEDQYRQERAYLRGHDPDNLIAKGRHNLTQNCLGEFIARGGQALDTSLNDTYDEAVQKLAAMATDAGKRAEFAAMLDRQELIRQFHNGVTRFFLEYERQKPGQPPIWVRTDMSTFKAPHSDDIECFMYTYDLTREILERQVMEKLPGLGYDFLSIIDVEKETYAYLRHLSEAAETLVDTDISYEESILVEIERYVLPAQRDRVRRYSRLPMIVKALEVNGRYTTVYSIRNSRGVIRQRCGQFAYVDGSRRTLFYCRSDVTEQYESEQRQLAQLQEAKQEADAANAAKSQFLSNISHDMRTPLNGIIGFSNLALHTEDRTKKQDYLQKINHSGELLLDLINDTLDLSKIESGTLVLRPERVNFSDVIEDVTVPIRAMAESKGQHVTVHLEQPAFGWVNVDRLQLKKIALNLLSNAVKYTGEGGHIDLTVKKEGTVHGKADCCIVVSDTGIGIKPDFLPRIYEPFAQASPFTTGNAIGTGLGLAIVKRIVDLMGGTIAVESTVGTGTRFTLHLPMEEVAPARDGDAAVEALPTLAGLQVLMCEDNELNAEITQTILKEKGVTVTWAADGQQGLDLFRAAAPGHFQAILMDLRMPVLDGIETARVIRSLDRADARQIPIIAITADAYQEDIKRCREAGMNGHVAKPIVPELLFAELAKVKSSGKWLKSSGQ
jgi:signal transduction histidine kinase/PAS domain-containing protein